MTPDLAAMRAPRRRARGRRRRPARRPHTGADQDRAGESACAATMRARSPTTDVVADVNVRVEARAAPYGGGEGARVDGGERTNLDVVLDHTPPSWGILRTSPSGPSAATGLADDPLRPPPPGRPAEPVDR